MSATDAPSVHEQASDEVIKEAETYRPRCVGCCDRERLRLLLHDVLMMMLGHLLVVILVVGVSLGRHLELMSKDVVDERAETIRPSKVVVVSSGCWCTLSRWIDTPDRSMSG